MARSRIWAREKVCASAQPSGVLVQTEIEAAICGCTGGGTMFETLELAHPAIPRNAANNAARETCRAGRTLRIGTVEIIFVIKMELNTRTNVDRSSWSLRKSDSIQGPATARR